MSFWFNDPLLASSKAIIYYVGPLSLSLSFPISIPLRSEMGALFSSLDLFRASVRPQYNGTN